ncbi:MAG: hypothetical protein V3V95_06240, partial [Thermodesulfobacteriota bacterium]
IGKLMETLEENAINDNPKNLFSFPPKKLAIILIVVFIAVGALFTVQAVMTDEPVLTGNEASHIFLLESTVHKGRFDSDFFRIYGGDASFYEGKYYSNKPPGYSFFLTVPYFLYVKAFGAERPFNQRGNIFDAFHFMKYSNVLLSSLSIVMIALFLSTFKLSDRSIAFGTAAAAFGTIYPAYSVLATSIPLSLLLSISSIFFYRLFKLDRDNLIFWTISVFCAAYAVITDYSNGFFLFPLVILALIDTKLKLRFLISALICSLPICLLLYYNYIIFKNPFTLTYSYYIPSTYVEWEGVGGAMSFLRVPRGYYGLLFSPARGLFLLSPVAVLGILALRPIFKERSLDLKITAIMAFSLILVISSYRHWHGGHSIGYRHIILSGVIIASLSAFFFESAGRPIKILAVIILLFSCFTGIFSFFIEHDVELLKLTWKAEPADIHSNYYTELLFPYLRKHW